MNNLNDIAGIDLDSSKSFDITEEILMNFKGCDTLTKMNFYFVLVNKLNNLTNLKEKAHLNFLLSYYLFIIFTPLKYESLSLNYINIALSLDDNLKYKEWFLIFGTIEGLNIDTQKLLSFANEVLSNNPSNEFANMITLMN